MLLLPSLLASTSGSLVTQGTQLHNGLRSARMVLYHDEQEVYLLVPITQVSRPRRCQLVGARGQQRITIFYCSHCSFLPTPPSRQTSYSSLFPPLQTDLDRVGAPLLRREKEFNQALGSGTRLALYERHYSHVTGWEVAVMLSSLLATTDCCMFPSKAQDGEVE